MGYALHQAAISQEDPGEVVYHVKIGTIELCCQRLFGNGHTHGIGDSLTQRTSGGLNARRITVFGVSRRLAVQLTEVFQLFHGQVIATQVQQRVNQH